MKIAGAATPGCDEFKTEMSISTCGSCLQFVFFFKFVIWKQHSSSNGWMQLELVAWLKAIFSPFLVDSSCKSFPLKDYHEFGFPALLGNVLYLLKIGTFELRLAWTENALINEPPCFFCCNFHALRVGAGGDTCGHQAGWELSSFNRSALIQNVATNEATIMPGSQELQLVCLLIGRIAVNLLWWFVFFYFLIRNKDTFVPIRNTSCSWAVNKSKKK